MVGLGVNRHGGRCNRALQLGRILHRYVKDHRDGMLIEQAAAGLLDTDHRTTAGSRMGGLTGIGQGRSEIDTTHHV
jgi:hypothetical protein